MRYESSNDREQRGHLRDCSIKEKATELSSLDRRQCHVGDEDAPDHKRIHSKQNSCAHTGMIVRSRKGCKHIVQCSCSRSSFSFGCSSFGDGDGDGEGSSLIRFGDGGDVFIMHKPFFFFLFW